MTLKGVEALLKGVEARGGCGAGAWAEAMPKGGSSEGVRFRGGRPVRWRRCFQGLKAQR
ncbi:hypothetical protein GCM10010404_52120 [Nonomuraea africana]